MASDISGQIEDLNTKGTAQLLAQYKELFGDKAAPGNPHFCSGNGLIGFRNTRWTEFQIEGISDLKQ